MSYIKNYLIKQGIAEDEAELSSYGVNKLFLFVINIVAFEFIGLVFSCPVDLFIFLLVYIPLRIYAGGFHFKKLIFCEIMSTAVVCLVALVLKKTSGIELSVIAIWVPLCMLPIHYVYAPQDNDNKRLYDHEKRRYKKITGTIVTVYYAISLLLYCKGCWRLQLIILLTLFLSTISIVENLIYEYIKRK